MEVEDTIDNAVESEDEISPMGKKMIDLWSRLSDSMSPEIKSRFQDIMKQYEELDDPEKSDFQDSLKQKLNEHFTRASSLHSFAMWSTILTVIICAALILFLFVFFGYKLYKSLKDKERKRDEKKKLRQQKKKK